MWGALKNIVVLTWRYRKTYANARSVLRSLLLRISVGPRGARLFHRKLVSIKVRGLDTPVWLRQKTSDFQIFMAIFEQQTYDVVHKAKLPEAPVIFDFGGNIGLASLRMSMLFENLRCLVVEPDTENGAMLQKNVGHVIAAGKLQLVQGFVSEHDGFSGIDRSGAASEIRMKEETAGGERIAMYSVDTLLKKAGVERIDLLKVDIEGAEAALFHTCRSWIGRVSNILVEIDPPYTREAFEADLRLNGAACEVLSHRTSELLVRVLPVAAGDGDSVRQSPVKEGAS